MILAKEIDGVMWVTAADHQAEVSRLQAESATLSNSLAQCRDAVNPHDEKDGWDISMGLPSAVPDLVKRRFDALHGQVANLHFALTNLTDVLNSAESNASGNPDWVFTSSRIKVARDAMKASATIAAAHDARVRNETIEECEAALLSVPHGASHGNIIAVAVNYLRALKDKEAV